MAEIKNNFIKSKMNKDLDDRLVPSGEYRDALNIAISRSEGDDVGALETILGNELYYGESSYGTCIGLFVDQNNKKTYYFVTNYIDTSADGLSNFAPLEVYCAVIQYNHVTDYKTVLVEGQFLNFSARSPITGVNLIEDLLFWTDNRNQPRKINVTNANAFPAAPSDTQRIPSQIPTPYYTTEDQISVAKYYPWKPISLMNIGDVALGTVPTQSTMSNPTQEFYPNGTSPKPDYDENWPGDSNYLTDRFIRLSYRFKFDDNEYSLMAPFTQPCFIPKQNGYFIGDDFKETYRSTVVNFFENNVTQILANIEFETLTPNVDLKIKEVEILYKESNALQAKSIESIDIKTVMANMSANAAHGGNPRVFTYKYISTKPYKNITEDQITRVFDKVPTRALAQEIAGNRVIYGNFHTVQTPPQNIDYNISYGNKTDLLGVSQIEYPNHTLKQNRNYQVGFVLADRFGRQSSVILSANDVAALSGGDYFGGSTIYVPYKPAGGTSALDWPGYALRALVNKPIPSRNELNITGYPGLYKDESYGADYVVITQGGSGYTNGNYLASVTGGTGSGLTVQVRVNGSTVRDVLIINNGTGYTDGDQVTVDGGNSDSVLTLAVSKPNLLGWYSYKIVVRQTEQDYYNVYLPSILNGYPASYIDGTSGLLAPNTEIGETANIVLYNDNINKVPRDLKEVGPDQKQYRSSVTLYGRVTPNNLQGSESVSSTQFYPEIIGDSVVSISTLADTNYNATTLGNITQLDTGVSVSSYSLEYTEFYQCNTNPLIARISTSKPIGRTSAAVTPNYSWATGLGVYETDPLDSLLDIYWETTSCGLISDLNLAILEGGFEGAVRTNGYNFILNEGDGPGTNCFPATGGPLPTPPDAYDGVQVISAQGNLMYEGVEWELLYIKDYSGAIRTQQFELYDTGAAGTQLDPLSFNIKTSSDAYFYYGSNELVRTFIAAVRVTYTNPISLEVTITTVILDDLKLDNVRPIAVEGGDCAVPIPGSQLPTNPLNSDTCLIPQPVIPTLVTSDDFDGNIYFVNGSNCAGDDTLTELSIIQPVSSYIDTSVEPNVEYPWDPRFELRQIGPGHVQLWLKADVSEPFGTVKRLYVQAIDAGGRRDSSYVYVNAAVVQRSPIEISIGNAPVCLPYGQWNGNSGGTVRIPFTLDNMVESYNYKLDLWKTNSSNSDVSFAADPCGPFPVENLPGILRADVTGPPQLQQPLTYYLDVAFGNDSRITINMQMRYNGELQDQPSSVTFDLASVTTIAQQLYLGPNNGQCGDGSSTCTLLP
mgnify:CR=1 FL=1